MTRIQRGLRSPVALSLLVALAVVTIAVGLAAPTDATSSSTAAVDDQPEDDDELGDGDVEHEEFDGVIDEPAGALGPTLYRTQCASCHGLDGEGVEGRGPTLETEGAASADFVLRTGRMPLAQVDQQAMPKPVRYSEEEIVALVAYVAAIGDGPDVPDVDAAAGDVAVGGELYRLNCAACHVASGSGAPIGGGRQAPSLIDSTPTEVGEAILIGPGSMPVFGSLDAEQIDDIAAYVLELQRQDATSPQRFGGVGPAAEGLAAWILGLIPLIALTRWIGRPKEGRDRPLVAELAIEDAPIHRGDRDGDDR